MVSDKAQPVDRSTAARDELLASAPQGSGAVGRQVEHEAALDRNKQEPPKSFFRGVAVGIAIMIPIWAWLILRFLH